MVVQVKQDIGRLSLMAQQGQEDLAEERHTITKLAHQVHQDKVMQEEVVAQLSIEVLAAVVKAQSVGLAVVVALTAVALVV